MKLKFSEIKADNPSFTNAQIFRIIGEKYKELLPSEKEALSSIVFPPEMAKKQRLVCLLLLF